MAHVFRLYTDGGNNNSDGWTTSNGYGVKAIDGIKDPQGSTYKKEITSIPSPFARMDLMKTAFRQVVESGNLDDNLTIHHKLVSECFDVAEIFFNIEKLRDKFEIITWNRKDSLGDESTENGLTKSATPAHRQLGDTLSMYLDQDSKAYNFEMLQNIYLLNYKGPGAPGQMNIVGATSPATLFFTSANNLDYVSANVQFGNKKPFNSSFQPLYKRDTNFILFWFMLKNLWPQFNKTTNSSFSSLFKEVSDYLDLTYKKLNQEQKNKVNALTMSEWNSLSPLSITTKSNTVEIFGCELRCLDLNSSFRTDFKIQSEFQVDGNTPLVLPVDTFKKSLVYTQDLWDAKTVVPIHDSLPIEQRKLPNDGRVYPYLTMGDFLEDTIICNRFQLNNSDFYDGGDVKGGESNDGDAYSYLIPVKTDYFKMFTLADLKKHLKIERSDVGTDKSVKVTLEIPIKAANGNINYITYERFYFENNKSNDPNDKTGNIVVKDFAMHVFPFLKFKNPSDADYRIVVADLEEDETYRVTVGYESSIFVPNLLVERNRSKDGELIKTGRSVISPCTFVIKNVFSYICLEVEGVKNLIIPEFKGRENNNTFEFAVDFGTSNTHIEYRADGGQILPFDITEEECLLRPLNKNYGIAYDNVILSDFFPDVIGRNYRFPTRTVLSEKKGLDWIGSSVVPMAETNVPLVYQTMPLPEYNKTSVDLKWSKESESQARITSYIENLILLMRNKVLVNGGKLSDTKIVWFYPASMSTTRANEIRTIWRSKYGEYFGGEIESQVIMMSESVAPYYYYKKNNSATTEVVSVDIGGGTSDILIVRDGRPTYLSSCRFAANTIFDCQPCPTNPFVNKYASKISSILQSNNLGGINDLAEKVRKEGKAASEIVMLWFSLMQNEGVKANKIMDKLDYSAMLYSDEKLKLLFLLFYTSLVYHISRIMKAKSLPFPRHLTFSGTGSKILKILVDIADVKILEDYTKLIFQKVYGEPYNRDGLSIVINTLNPKEVTCKGGLTNTSSISPREIEEMKLTLVGGCDDAFVTSNMKYSDISDSEIESVVREIERFMNLFYELNEEFSFNKNFGTLKTNELESLKDYFSHDITKYIRDGIREKDTQDEIGETLFFYPIRGIISAIGGDQSML
jgi:hypothetical protein